jgi:hypothetical protein
MSKPSLTAERLLQAGFTEIGCWELNESSNLAHSISLPKKAGVYAFVIDGVVQYVGLASKSLHQRLNFYRKPGASQRTNVRLNEIIKGHVGKGSVVRIMVAHPPDYEWNGLLIKGSEGLEAGIIASFALPWNMRGMEQPVGSAQLSPPSALARQSGIESKILDVVRRRPGMTELEIAKALHGPSAVQQQVNSQCRALLKQGKIGRRGSGGAGDPYTYHLENR